MKPGIGSIFDSLFHWQGFMIRPRILFRRLVVQDTGPYHHPSLFGLYCQIEIIEMRSSTLFDVIEIQEHCDYSYMLGPVHMVTNVIVVTAIELTLFIFQQLQMLAIDSGDSGNIFHGGQYILGDGILLTVSDAPLYYI
jgi:hypothetical protein